MVQSRNQSHKQPGMLLRSLLGLATVAPLVWAQATPGASGGGPSRALTLPLSGQTGMAGSASAQQTANPGSGVSTVNSSVQVSGNLNGSISGGDVPPGAIRLTLADAIKRGLATNLGPISSANAQAQASANRLQGRSALLPNIGLNASETVTQVNLAAYGLNIQAPPGSPFSIPTVVGPYSYSQLQGTLSQSVLDLVNLRNYKAFKESERAASLSARDTRELVIFAVAGTYLQTVATSARLLSQRAQVDNAQAIYNQAVVRKEAGTNARIDVVRSLVELQTQQQRLSSIQSDFQKQKIALARLIGLPLDRELQLQENFSSSDVVVPDAHETVGKAWNYRSDLRAAEAQVRAAELAVSAAHAERYPSVTLNGNYGVIGPNPAHTHGVFAVTGSVSVPLWEGGRIKGDIQEAETALRQRRAELSDGKRRVEQDVRNALIELQTALGQVRLAETNRNYANETVTEARDRFSAGVATTVEVVQAQEQVASAESDYISSLFSFNLAKLSLARATGEAETSLPNLLQGDRP
jgi:outer membrane protein TolC